MNKLRIIISFLIFSLSFTSAQYQLEDAFPNLPNFTSPVDFQNASDNTNRVFVVEQPGRIKVFDNKEDISSTKTFLNITDKVISSGSEEGLLGLAFPPDYENNGYFYIYYTAPNPLRSIVARYRVSLTNPDSADKNSELILLTQNQPYSNHNAGQLAFGPDGYFYIGFGDGGSSGDPNDNGQNKSTFLGKILRIDVDNSENGMNYGIPADNPFKDNTEGYKEEIYAYGFRNPWRFSFDPVTGWLWCADVGQNLYEEIDIVENGKNYGWRCYEGNHTYNSTGCGDISEYTFPIWEYAHGPECSITGGYVYHGANQQELTGKYIYGDYCSNKIWALSYDGVNPATNKLLLTASSSPYSFGIDEVGELYLCTGGGRIFKLKPTSGTAANNVNFLREDYYLKQNYPNPFNPITTITYNVPEESNVRIELLNSIGEVVERLINEIRTSGIYKNVINASEFASGVYYVRMVAASVVSDKVFRKTIKMLYLK